MLNTRRALRALDSGCLLASAEHAVIQARGPLPTQRSAGNYTRTQRF